MTCAEHEERFSAYLDGELSPSESAALDGHVASCEGCRSALEALRAQASDLDAAFAPLRARAASAVPGVLAALRTRAPVAPGASAPATSSAPAAPILRPRWPLLVPFVSAAAGFFLAVAIFAWGPIGPLVPQSPVAVVPGAPPVSAPPTQPAPPQQAPTPTPPPPPAPPSTPPPPPGTPPPPPQPPEKHLAPVVATLQAATGALDVKDDGDWKPLASGGSIGDGAWVRTVGRAKGSFVCSDGSEVRLNADTEVQLACRTLVLKKGEIYTKVARDPTTRFSVSTDAGRIEAIGTTLDIAHSEVTTLNVIEGKALVGDKTVNEGWRCTIANGVPAEATRSEQLEILTAWVGELVEVHGAGDADFQKRINKILRDIGSSKAGLDEQEIRRLGDHCALPLARYLESPEENASPYTRERAARILADVAPKALLGDLATLLEDKDPKVRVEAARGIERITGERRYSADTWTGTSYHEAAKAWREELGDPKGPWCSPPTKNDGPRRDSPDPDKDTVKKEPEKKAPEPEKKAPEEKPGPRGGGRAAN